MCSTFSDAPKVAPELHQFWCEANPIKFLKAVEALRKENDDLKLKLKGIGSELEWLKAFMKLTTQGKEEQEHVFSP